MEANDKLLAVVNALESLPIFQNPGDRNTLISLLRGEISGAVTRTGASRVEAISLVQTCSRFPGGLTELAHAIHVFDAESPESARVDDALQQLIALDGDDRDRGGRATPAP
jgi:hypothetical protein